MVCYRIDIKHLLRNINQFLSFWIAPKRTILFLELTKRDNQKILIHMIPFICVNTHDLTIDAAYHIIWGII